ncbi:MAG: hypothetical protein MAG794_00880 [Gammaproteobacteria bacterium]|nr:hypothetical protein [Gammaproteobacteria bacterium]
MGDADILECIQCKFSITPCKNVGVGLSFRAVESTEAFARAYREVSTASLKDNPTPT